MKNYQWKASYATNIDILDLQHHELLSISARINQISANSDKLNQNALNDILHELRAYTIYHFATEEFILESFRL